MSHQKRIYIYITIGAVVMGFMIFSLVQMLGYANIINDAGIVRGGTQHLVKLELDNTKTDESIATIDSLLQKLQSKEAERFFIPQDTQIFKDHLAAADDIWQLVKADIEAYRLNPSPENRAKLIADSERHFFKANEAVFSAQYRAENELKWSLIASVTAFFAFITFVLVINRHGQKELERVFYTDHLTDLPNQKAFDITADKLLSTNPPGTYCTVYININNFKFVNNSYGFEVGDNLLIVIAKALQNFCKSEEFCGHLHADHFVLVIKWREHLSETLETLLTAAIRNEKALNLSDVLSCSYGIYHAQTQGESSAACISKASLALKEGHLNTHHAAFYDAYLRDKITTENNLTLVMHQAFNKHEFVVYLQPKVDFRDLRIIGAESLVRWKSKEYGFLSPDSFIPLFEKNGFIVDLDFYVLAETCRVISQALRHSRDSVIPVSVNVSRVTLFQNDFIERFKNLVDSYNLPHNYIEVEITETFFIFDNKAVLQILTDLRNLGFKISMDDFGSGYSSLKMLKDLPIDVIKIDHAFLQEGLCRERAFSIIKCVVEMAHSLNMKVVCEGVETIDHVHFLTAVNCAIGQGYYFSRPIPLKEFQNKYQRLLS